MLPMGDVGSPPQFSPGSFCMSSELKEIVSKEMGNVLQENMFLLCYIITVYTFSCIFCFMLTKGCGRKWVRSLVCGGCFPPPPATGES